MAKEVGPNLMGLQCPDYDIALEWEARHLAKNRDEAKIYP